ncbi:MAG: lysophospholipid acyltransferase family protein [Magnetococcales bacterium]|nr:lysophospholipid acyltransferase family protein [Magnetococcales bacterium]
MNSAASPVANEHPLVRLDQVLSGHLARPLAKTLARLLEPLLAIDQFNRKYQELSAAADHGDFLEKALAALTGAVRVDPAELARIPVTGPLLVVANHPFGGIEGILLAVVLRAIRPDVKILGNHLLAHIPEFRELLFAVDPFAGPGATRRSLTGVRQAIRWVRSGGATVIFPAGEVSHLDLHARGVVDPEWDTGAARLARLTGAAVTPIFFQGSNGLLFQMAGLFHPRFRTALLPRELLNKTQRTICLRVGQPIAFERLQRFPDDQETTIYLRLRTELLDANDRSPDPADAAAAPTAGVLQELLPPRGPLLLHEEVGRLPPCQRLMVAGDLQVCYADSRQIPLLLEEIGRLREMTFRAAGEGTGNSLDLDRFDGYYRHLFVWNRVRRELVGAYRMGHLEALLAGPHGKKSLYTATLFKYRTGFLRSLGPALELGRSFVQPAYQRNYAPLLLLWKGIGRYVAVHPECRTLFGAVSVAAEYTPTSRKLIVDYLTHHRDLGQKSRMIKARKPFRVKGIKGLTDSRSVRVLEDVDELSGLISQIERDGKGIPILLKQYLKLGGRLAGFSIDPTFNNTLDGLIFVDLMDTDPRILAKYMGSNEAEAFRRHHSRPPDLSDLGMPLACLSHLDRLD